MGLDGSDASPAKRLPEQRFPRWPSGAASL